MTTADTWRAIGAAFVITLGVGIAVDVLAALWLVVLPRVF